MLSATFVSIMSGQRQRYHYLLLLSCQAKVSCRAKVSCQINAKAKVSFRTKGKEGYHVRQRQRYHVRANAKISCQGKGKGIMVGQGKGSVSGKGKLSCKAKASLSAQRQRYHVRQRQSYVGQRQSYHVGQRQTESCQTITSRGCVACASLAQETGFIRPAWQAPKGNQSVSPQTFFSPCMTCWTSTNGASPQRWTRRNSLAGPVRLDKQRSHWSHLAGFIMNVTASGDVLKQVPTGDKHGGQTEINARVASL